MSFWIRQNWKFLILIGVAFFIGLMISPPESLKFSREDKSIQLRENSPKYKFINPLILTTDNKKIQYEEYNDLKNNINKYINKKYQSNSAEDISFYFRDLNGGEWVGVNEEDKYAPASMLKVSTLMAFLKLASDDPGMLLDKVEYKPSDVSGQFYKPKQLEAGSYSTRELLEQMIVESDNDAMIALNKLHTNEIAKIYQDLDLPDLLSDEDDFMSPRLYSRFFRVFYNGSYLSHFYSDEALGLLAVSNFNEGMVSGVKSGTVVAHKFGELTNTSVSGTKRELHDCGIVYFPEKPYFLCVMTKGKDFSELEKIISDISKITFDYVESRG